MWIPCSSILGNSICKVDTSEKLIFLTFDDGPGEETVQILNVLKKENVSALFFLVGDQVSLYPEILPQIVNEGHVLGVHALYHTFLTRNNLAQITEMKLLLESKTTKPVLFFRPPYGFRTPTTMRVAKENSLMTVLWSSFPRDYSSTTDQITRRVARSLQPGVIITLHDGPAGRTNTLDAVSIIIKNAREQDYRFATAKEIETLMSMELSS